MIQQKTWWMCKKAICSWSQKSTLKWNIQISQLMITLKNPHKLLTVSVKIGCSLSGSIRSSSLHSELQLKLLLSRSGRRKSTAVLVWFPGWYFILEDHAEQFSPQSVGQPRVFDNGHLEALAAEHGVVVGVNGSTHSLDDHQVGLPLPHNHRQNFVQAAGKQQRRRITWFLVRTGALISLSYSSSPRSQLTAYVSHTLHYYFYHYRSTATTITRSKNKELSYQYSALLVITNVILLSYADYFNISIIHTEPREVKSYQVRVYITY